MVLQFPEPIAVDETFFVATVFDDFASGTKTTSPGKGVEAAALRCFALEQASALPGAVRLIEHTAPARNAKMVSGVKTARVDRPDALFGWFIRDIGERTGANVTATPPILPLRSLAPFTHHEIALFASDLNALHVGDASTGTVIALRKSAADRWVCRLDAADGHGITARLPSFNPTRENVARVSAGVARLTSLLAARMNAAEPSCSARDGERDLIALDACSLVVDTEFHDLD